MENVIGCDRLAFLIEKYILFLPGTNIESFNEEQVDHEEQLTIEEIDIDELEVLEGAGAVDGAQGNNTLINELRSEMRREIRRLKNISIPGIFTIKLLLFIITVVVVVFVVVVTVIIAVVISVKTCSKVITATS